MLNNHEIREKIASLRAKCRERDLLLSKLEHAFALLELGVDPAQIGGSMNRDQWTHAQLMDFVAPVGKRSGYPSLFMRFQHELTEAIRSHTFLVPGCCWRPYQLAEWDPESSVFAALARLCAPLSGIKYPDVYPVADGLVVELHYYTPSKGKPVDLTRTIEVIHTLQALGLSVDVFGWRHE